MNKEHAELLFIVTGIILVPNVLGILALLFMIVIIAENNLGSNDNSPDYNTSECDTPDD